MGGDQKSIAQLNYLYQYIMPYFAAHNIKFILFYGTLLGYIRNNDFINNDDDIDMIFPLNEKNKILNIVKQNNIKKGLSGYNPKHLTQLSSDKVFGFEIYDYEDKDGVIYIPHEKKWRHSSIYKKTDIYPLREVVYKNFKVYIPNNPEAVLEQTYGKTWRTPISKSSSSYEQVTGNPGSSISWLKRNYIWLIIFILVLIIFILFLKRKKK